MTVLFSLLLQAGLACLHYAAWQGSVDAVGMLLEAGADINSRDPVGFRSASCLPLQMPYDIHTISYKLLSPQQVPINTAGISRHLLTSTVPDRACCMLRLNQCLSCAARPMLSMLHVLCHAGGHAPSALCGLVQPP